MDFAVHQILPDMLAAVERANPNIRIELVYLSTSRQRSALLGLVAKGLGLTFYAGSPQLY